MLRVDFHTHTIKSEHAVNTLEETLRQAEKNGMEAIASTDHCPGIDNTCLLPSSSEERQSWKRRIRGPDIHYFNILLTRYQAPPDTPVVLFKGIECNILSDGEVVADVPLKFADRFDIVIASLHAFPFLFEVKSKEQITERMITAMEHPIDILGHPYMRSSCPHLEPLAKAAADRGIVLELNNAALKLNKAPVENVASMLRFARRFDCRISLGSDSHMNNELGADREIDRLLKELEFPEELIVNATLADAQRYVAERKEYRSKFVPR